MESDEQARPFSNVKTRTALHCCVGIMLMVYLAAAISLIIVVHINLFGQLVNFQLLRAHLMCGGFGVLGAAMAAMRKFYRILISEGASQLSGQSFLKINWNLGWMFYFITRPILGGILGALSYTLSFVGFNTLASSPDMEISTHGRFLLYGFAFVSGFGVSQVLDRLNAIAKQLFQHKSEEEGM